MQVSLRWWHFVASVVFLCTMPWASAIVTTAAADASPASFDCSKAVGVDTDIICSDPLLRRADNDLGRLYRSLVADADGQARADALKNDERNWILRRNSQCGVSKSLKINQSELPGYVECFLAAYDERVDDLRRMRADPKADPSAISSPIRKSSFGDAIAEVPIPAGALVETGLVAADTTLAVLGFRSDHSLVVLGSKSDQPELAVFVFKSGQIQSTLAADAPIPSNSSLCIAGSSIVVLPAADPSALVASAATQDKLSATPISGLSAEMRRACAISADRELIGSPDGSAALDLGPRVVSVSDGSRFVALQDAQGAHGLAPPIRIDRRYPPMGQFNLGTGKFVVSPGPRPKDARAILDRSWAKTNCGTFWLVDPATRRSASACLPFGSYVDETNESIATPLPTRSGLYFSIANRGLFKVVDGTAKRVVAAPVGQPVVAGDGCSIAFVASPAKSSSEHRVMLLNTCAIR